MLETLKKHHSETERGHILYKTMGPNIEVGPSMETEAWQLQRKCVVC